MSIEQNKSLSNYLAISETELLLEIEHITSGQPQLRSPESRIEEAKAFLAGIRPRLQKLVCPQKELADQPEFELATDIAKILANSFVPALATAVAAYVVKRGLSSLCHDWKSSDQVSSS